ncbi:hypothetical protein THAOC_28558, partial [Thalassiosira oceanica]
QEGVPVPVLQDAELPKLDRRPSQLRVRRRREGVVPRKDVGRLAPVVAIVRVGIGRAARPPVSDEVLPPLRRGCTRPGSARDRLPRPPRRRPPPASHGGPGAWRRRPRTTWTTARTGGPGRSGRPAGGTAGRRTRPTRPRGMRTGGGPGGAASSLRAGSSLLFKNAVATSEGGVPFLMLSLFLDRGSPG